MKQRNSDCDKWRVPEFRKLTLLHKLITIYLEENCDHAGVWLVDKELAEMQICGGVEFGQSIDWNAFIRALDGRYVFFDGSKRLYDTTFIERHYPTGLSEGDRFHQHVIKAIAAHKSKGLPSPLYGLKDKDIDKDLEKDLPEGVRGNHGSDTDPPAAIPSVEAVALLVDDLHAKAKRVVLHKQKLEGIEMPVLAEHVAPINELLQRGFSVEDMIAVLDHEWQRCKDDKKQRQWFQVKLLFKPETFPDRLAAARPRHRKPSAALAARDAAMKSSRQKTEERDPTARPLKGLVEEWQRKAGGKK